MLVVVLVMMLGVLVMRRGVMRRRVVRRRRRLRLLWILTDKGFTIRTDDPEAITTLCEGSDATLTGILDLDKSGRGTDERKYAVNRLRAMRLVLITGKIRIFDKREADGFSEGVGHLDHLPHHARAASRLDDVGARGTSHDSVYGRMRNPMAKAQFLR